MGYKLFFDKSLDKVVCTILSQNIYTHLHTFAPLSIWNHAIALKLLLTVFSLQNCLRHLRIFVSSEHFLFFLPPPIIFDHNQIKFGESLYIRQGQARGYGHITRQSLILGRTTGGQRVQLEYLQRYLKNYFASCIL